MGMFDHYIPVPDLSCAGCGGPLSDWQGKDGPCQLLIWTQMQPRPARDDIPSQEIRLPDGELAIYTQCATCGSWADADCVVVNGIWMDASPTKCVGIT